MTASETVRTTHVIDISRHSEMFHWSRDGGLLLSRTMSPEEHVDRFRRCPSCKGRNSVRSNDFIAINEAKSALKLLDEEKIELHECPCGAKYNLLLKASHAKA